MMEKWLEEKAKELLNKEVHQLTSMEAAVVKWALRKHGEYVSSSTEL